MNKDTKMIKEDLLLYCQLKIQLCQFDFTLHVFPLLDLDAKSFYSSPQIKKGK